MARHRTHSPEFNRQAAQDYLDGETAHSFAKRHDLSRNLIRILVCKYEDGAFDDGADRLKAYCTIKKGVVVGLEVRRALFDSARKNFPKT